MLATAGCLSYKVMIRVVALFFFIILNVMAWAQKKIPVSVRWNEAGITLPMNGKENPLGVAGPVCGVDHNVLMVGGGANFPEGMPWNGGKKKYYNSLHLFKKEKGEVTFFKTIQLPQAIAYGANCSTSQGVVCAGGESENGISLKAFLLQWDDATQSVLITPLPDLPLGVANASMVCYDNKIYLAGGETSTATSNQFLYLDLNHTQQGWQDLKPLPVSVSHAVMVCQSNGRNECLYLIGGRSKNPNGISTLYSSVFEFDFKKSSWTVKNNLPYALCAGTGIEAGTHSILLFSGDSGETFHQVELLIAAINSEKEMIKKNELNNKKIAIQSSHPGFSKNILSYNTQTDAWKKIGVLPFEGQVTTTAIKWNEEVIIPSGEIRAGVRTPMIRVGKIVAK
ncbi:MAG: hypothetical protein JST69_08775 [Bacteroidetes bacterium]|nr:hypothetical protein [Bacteroidota bacterium]